MALESGTMVTTNVRLLSPIGEGAMGSVWLAEHLTLETEVAVKFIHEKVPNRDEAVTRFKREAAVAAKIKSPHIVQVFDQGVMEDGTPYIVMERLEGEGLDARLERVGRLSMRQTAQIVSQVAKGLRAAHKVGIVHRDIKPANIFLVPVDEGKLIKLVDFGIAKTTRVPESRKLTQEGLLIGTPEYICRDQIVLGTSADDMSDLWALAVVAYECLTGECPFGGSTIGMVCANIVGGEYTPPSQVRDDVPVEIDRWFEKCFATAREERYPSAREMALDFVHAVPSRVGDIEAELLDPGQVKFSGMKRGTAVGLQADREFALNDADLEDDFDDDDGTVPPSKRGDWDASAGEDASLAETSPAPSVRGAQPSRRGAPPSSKGPRSRQVSLADEEGIEADAPPTSKGRGGLLGIAVAAVALAAGVTWFVVRPSAAKPQATAASTAAAQESAPSATASTPVAPPTATAAPAPQETAAATASAEAAPTPSTEPSTEAASTKGAPTKGTPVVGKPTGAVTKPAGSTPPPPPPTVKPGSHDDLGF